jgi:hypothetical protein
MEILGEDGEHGESNSEDISTVKELLLIPFIGAVSAGSCNDEQIVMNLGPDNGTKKV